MPKTRKWIKWAAICDDLGDVATHNSKELAEACAAIMRAIGAKMRVVEVVVAERAAPKRGKGKR